jgi:hypothetical protein
MLRIAYCHCPAWIYVLDLACLLACFCGLVGRKVVGMVDTELRLFIRLLFVYLGEEGQGSGEGEAQDGSRVRVK